MRRNLGPGIAPAAVGRDERIGFFRPPTVAPVGTDAMVGLEDRLDDHPRGFDRVFAGEKRAIPRFKPCPIL